MHLIYSIGFVGWIITLLIIYGVVPINGQSLCPLNERMCQNGECIDEDEFCDGMKDCRDGSDETAEACVQIRCPEYAFRCTYGGCVVGNAQCNNKTECADGSDELPILCSPSYTDKIENNCLDKYECQSGECIAEEDVCDGIVNCKDGSDETVTVCGGKTCPTFAFVCGYGACVSGKAQCNGIIDCADKSDEFETICGPTATTKGDNKKPSSERPPPQETTASPHSNDCWLGDLKDVIVVYEGLNDTEIRQSTNVAEFINIQYKCTPKRILTGNKTNICSSGKWMNEHPTCDKYCLPEVITGITITPACEYKGLGISCNQPLKPGTRVTISCQVGYKKQTSSDTPSVIVCDNEGEWDYYPLRCVQECGREEIQSTPFIIGGQERNNSAVPWHVGIYSKVHGNYSQICGGTIINAKVIITAAHCFWDVQNDEPYDKSFFTVAVGKFYRDFYYPDEPLRPQVFNVYELHIRQGYKDINLYYQNDLAILVLDNFITFNAYVKPICVEWNLIFREKHMKSGVWGRIAGWGLTAADGKASPRLRILDTKSLSGDDCLSKTDVQFQVLVTGDKFCSGNENGETVCTGDSGGGFVVPKMQGGVRQYYLWGIVSNGLTSIGTCSGNFYTTFTNIHYHIDLIIDYELKYRPK